VFRLPQYVKQIQSGGINARPNIRILNDRAGAALIDGDNALGHLVMKRAAELAIEKARKCGIGWVGTRRSNHHACSEAPAARAQACSIAASSSARKF